jgi:voltage-gated potassium channel
MISVVMLTGIYASSRLRRSVTIGAGLAVPALASHWGTYLIPHHVAYALHYTLTILLLSYATTTILAAVVGDAQVTIETIKGAVCVSLLLGLTWVYFFGLIDLSAPDSFRIAKGPDSLRAGHILVAEMFPRMVYFSFATLTTLGYGDIVPQSAPAQTFCYLEAIVGQVFLTVLVARLVGMHISQPSRDDLPIA